MRFLCFVVVLSAVGLTLSGADASASAQLDRSSVYVGDPVTLSVTIRQVDGSIDLDPSQFKDFNLQEAGRSSFSNTQVINGRMTQDSGVVVKWVLTPKVSGNYSWQSLKLKVGQATLETGPLRLQVKTIEKQDDVILILETDDQTPVVQQSVRLRLRVLLKSMPLPYELVEPLISGAEPELSIPWLEDADGFKSEDASSLLSDLLSDENGFRINGLSRRGGFFMDNRAAVFDLPHQVITYDGSDGRSASYHQYIFERDLLPTEVGEHSLSPVTFKGVLPRQVQARGNRLEIIEKKNIRALSNTLSFSVQDVPLQGRPNTYTGGIGTFNIHSQVDRQELLVGEPLILTVTIRGQGLLDPIAMPDLKNLPGWSEQFKIYIDNPDGEIKDGEKVFQATLRALHDDVHVVPAVPLAFYDGRTETYTEIFSQEIPLSITAASELMASDIDPLIMPQTNVSPLSEREQGLVEMMTPAQILGQQRSVWRLGAWKFFNGLLALLCLFTWTARRWWWPHRQDSQGRLKRNAIRQARADLDALRKQPGDHPLDQIGLILLRCVAERSGKSPAGYTSDDAIKDLNKAGMSAEDQTAFQALMMASEQARFGGGSASTWDDHFEKASHFLRCFEEC